MTEPTPLPYFTLRHALASGTTTPRQVLEQSLERIGQWENAVGAWVVLEPDAARRDADQATARWKAGRPLSPIDGMPVGVKDIIDTADMPTQMGSPLYDRYLPRFDAASVSALRGAGAVVLGKTVTTEFASTEPRGTRNPWDPRRTPGGSSSGSAAAVATGMVPAALGTQVVGSTIRPAGFCGCYGYKPTYGAINRGGSLDFLSHSCTGVIAASLADTWLMAHEMARRVGGDPGCAPLIGPDLPPSPRRAKTLAILETPGWSVATESARDALGRTGAVLRERGIAIVTRRDEPRLEALESALADAEQVTRDIIAWEWLWPLNVLCARDPDNVTPASRERLRVAEAMTPEDYIRLLRRRDEIRAVHAQLAGRIDAAVTLAAPGAAPLGIHYTGNPVFVVPGSLLGVPAITLPKLRDEGLPLGLQLVGFSGKDADLFALAADLDAAIAAAGTV